MHNFYFFIPKEESIVIKIFLLPVLMVLHILECSDPKTHVYIKCLLFRVSMCVCVSALYHRKEYEVMNIIESNILFIIFAYGQHVFLRKGLCSGNFCEILIISPSKSV